MMIGMMGLGLVVPAVGDELSAYDLYKAATAELDRQIFERREGEYDRQLQRRAIEEMERHNREVELAEPVIIYEADPFALKSWEVRQVRDALRERALSWHISGEIE
jgi:hypothetical protein